MAILVQISGFRYFAPISANHSIFFIVLTSVIHALVFSLCILFRAHAQVIIQRIHNFPFIVLLRAQYIIVIDLLYLAIQFLSAQAKLAYSICNNIGGINRIIFFNHRFCILIRPGAFFIFTGTNKQGIAHITGTANIHGCATASSISLFQYGITIRFFFPFHRAFCAAVIFSFMYDD